MDKLLCASVMCFDAGNIRAEMDALEAAGIDMYHVDIMDGSFVPNFAVGLPTLEYILANADRPVDVHLMIDTPDAYAERFIDMGVEIVYIHPQTSRHPARLLANIAERGARAGLVIDPAVTVAAVEPLLNLADDVLVMAVNPGFAGQKYLPFVGEKLIALAGAKDKYGYRLLVDGACSPERIGKLSGIGVDGFILGTSALFGKGRPYDDIMAELRER